MRLLSLELGICRRFNSRPGLRCLLASATRFILGRPPLGGALAEINGSDLLSLKPLLSSRIFFSRWGCFIFAVRGSGFAILFLAYTCLSFFVESHVSSAETGMIIDTVGLVRSSGFDLFGRYVSFAERNISAKYNSARELFRSPYRRRGRA